MGEGSLLKEGEIDRELFRKSESHRGGDCSGCRSQAKKQVRLRVWILLRKKISYT